MAQGVRTKFIMNHIIQYSGAPSLFVAPPIFIEGYVKNNGKGIRPNKAELEFLTLAYHRFYDIFEEIMDDSFWEKDSWYRFSKTKEGFTVYSELLN